MAPLPRTTTHLFLDAGNTLVFVNMEVVSDALARHGVRLSPEELWRGEHLARRTVDTPEVIHGTDDDSRWAIYFRTILRECGAEKTDALGPVLGELHDYHLRVNLWEVVPPDVPPALEALRRSYRLGVISNSNGTVRRKLQRVGLAGLFEIIVDSHEEGIEKPDPRLFRIALDRAGAAPERSVYVGDLYHVDVVGARAAGMEAVLLDPGNVHADKPVRRIASLGELLAPP